VPSPMVLPPREAATHTPPLLCRLCPLPSCLLYSAAPPPATIPLPYHILFCYQPFFSIRLQHLHIHHCAFAFLPLFVLLTLLTLLAWDSPILFLLPAAVRASCC